MAYKSKERRDEANKKWNRNREYRSAYEKRWRENNREKYLEQRKKYYSEHKEELARKSLDYYRKVRRPDRKANRKKYKELDRLWAQKRRQKFRELFKQIKEEMGNKCAKCGYDKYPIILHFHHVENKTGNVSELKSFKKICEEAKKCILLCPNCHMELTFANR